VRVAARSEDGTVEAIEVGDADQDWIVAVQWHPELTLLDEQQLELLRAFILEAREARERRRDALE
jgi:putative glutamine amidotransferase